MKRHRRVLIIMMLVITCVMSFTLTACGADNPGSENTGPPEMTEAQAAVSETPTVAPTDRPTKNYYTEPRLYAEDDSYESYDYYLHNEVTNQYVYTIETIPASLEDGERVPLVIYVHGGTGNARTYFNLFKEIADDKIAALSFECCGAMAGKNGKSSGAELYSSHYTSRMTDLETVLDKALTLDYVDTSRIFLFGESYGGLVVSCDALRRGDEIAGLILVSTGIQSSMVGPPENENASYIAEYDFTAREYEDVLQEIQEYTGNVICLNGQEDGAHDFGAAQIEAYQERETGTAVFYSLENSGHGYTEFSPEAKEFTLQTILEFVNEQ